MPLFDTHCHIDVEDFRADRDQVLARARTAGVADILVPGVRRATWPALRALCGDDPGLHEALGLHPVYLAEHSDQDLQSLDDAISDLRPVAVGEIGLDHAVPGLDHRRQFELLDAQLAIAAAHRLPVVLHVRKAHDLMLKTLRRHDLPGGICHAFNGSEQQAHAYLDLGFRLGFGGMLTFERSRKLRRLASVLPASALVLETDAPDLTVASHRFERNSPEYLPEVATALSALRGLDAEEVSALTTSNAIDTLGLDGHRQ